jgi:hypothetical protein
MSQMLSVADLPEQAPGRLSLQLPDQHGGRRRHRISVPIYPNGNHRDEEINAYALPVLREATLAAQSA